MFTVTKSDKNYTALLASNIYSKGKMIMESNVTLQTGVKKIGIFRALYLGDMMCIIPTVRAIRRFYPDASITLIGLPWQLAFVKRFSMYFDDFLEFPGWPGLPEQHPDPEKIAAFLEDVHVMAFDLIFQMQGNGMETNYMCMRWGAGRVVGLKRAEVDADDAIFFPDSDDSDHEVLRFFKLLDAMNIPYAGTELEFPITESELHNYDRIQEQLSLHNSPYICIHPGARDPKRRWQLENFAHISECLYDMGYTIVLTGSLQEADLLKELEGHITHETLNIIDKFGDVDLGTLACFIMHSTLLVSNDTGVSHLASALRTPSVVIFSPYSAMERWAPLDPVRHRSINPDKAKDPDYVLSIVQDQLQKNKHQPLSLFDQI